jgi:chaperonin GroES
MSVNFTPAEGRALIERTTQETTSGGIVIPTAAQEKSDIGKIVKLGTPKTTENGTKVIVSFKEGDKVLFGKYSGTDVKINNNDYVIVNTDEVMGVFE